MRFLVVNNAHEHETEVKEVVKKKFFFNSIKNVETNFEKINLIWINKFFEKNVQVYMCEKRHCTVVFKHR